MQKEKTKNLSLKTPPTKHPKKKPTDSKFTNKITSCQPIGLPDTHPYSNVNTRIVCCQHLGLKALDFICGIDG
ncbi:Uncharacterized protein TCM_024332 [Theobroma cacao]|uniref:Uncharacterized protein n=1 Tax=Theobroma cacao TaxID=3641 RepID=A0A061EX42_THECC|nr:Uncharacterized protein TCM_024332 [Theobroma cacao]